MLLNNPVNKNLDFASCDEFFEQQRSQGQKIVLCNGVFDLLHPGHIAHLQAAKMLGDILVISLTASQYANRGPGRPIFSDDLRSQSLAALDCVDYVILTPAPTALEIIAKVKPHFYCKGNEYAESQNDVTNNIDLEIAQVRAFGGDVHFTNEMTFSSTKLINNHLNTIPTELKDYASKFGQAYSNDDIRQAIDQMKSLRVLVIGDIILDEFIHCTMQGLTSKGKAPSTRFQKQELHLGGVYAIARHLSSFVQQVTLSSVIGNEPHLKALIEAHQDNQIQMNLAIAEGYTTVTKRRYIEAKDQTASASQLFAINVIDEQGITTKVRQSLLASWEKELPNYDVVVLADYGHGLVDADALELIQAKAPFLALNCQTNSANYGYNLITKYHRADSFCIDEREIRLAFSDRASDSPALLDQLYQHLGAKQGWLTLGSNGSLGMQANCPLEKTPAMTQQVKDTTGAGDAFFALASLSAKLGLDLTLGSFLGNLAGALATNVLGNQKPVEKSGLLKFAKTVSSY